MNRKLFLITLFLLAATLSLLLYLHRPFLDSSPKLRVVFFDVGQGDSALITTPANQTILVDGGEGDRVLSKLGKYLPFYQKKINLMILTHPHADHLEGLIPVLKKYQIEQILYSGATHTTDAFLEWLGLIKDKNIPLKIVNRQQTITLDSHIRLDFLYPLTTLRGAGAASDEAILSASEDNGIASSSPRSVGGTPRNDNYEEESPYQKNNTLNNTSLVFKLTYGQTSFLFMGDAETQVEEELLRCKRGGKNCPLLTKEGIEGWLKSDVLKVAHHGSHSSTSDAFLEAVRPKIAVISVGKDNDFGHPHSRTLRRLERFGVKILRTDEKGDIKLESDGKRVGD